MSMTLVTVVLTVLCVVTGLMLLAVVGSGYVLSRRIEQRSEALDGARKKLAARVSQNQANQLQLQEIVIKLKADIQHIKARVDDAQQQQCEPTAARPVQDYERVVSLFAQGKADASVAQAMGLSRGEAELISRLADRSSSTQQ